jgi:hypothetical protein
MSDAVLFAGLEPVERSDDIPLAHARRVLVLGCPGSGKTTVGCALAHRSALPRASMDDLYWKARWRRPAPADWDTKLLTFLRGAAWILDGNYADCLELRLAYADTIVWVDVPSIICVGRVLARSVRRALGARDSLPRAIAEDAGYRPRLRVDPRFVAYVASFDRDVRPGMLERLRRFRGEGGMYRLCEPWWRGARR